MIIEITGTTSGQSPYDVFLCDPTNTGCFFVSGNTFIPPNVIIQTENYFPGEQILYIRLLDTNGCLKSYELVCGQKLFQDGFGFSFMNDSRYVFQ